MQAISSTALSILKSETFIGVSIAAVGFSGSLTIETDDLIEGSFSIDRNSVSGSNIEIGNAETAELVFVLDNFDGRFNDFVFEGAQLTVDLTIGTETLRAGIFTVDQRPSGDDTLKIIALDHMARFNRAYITDLTGKPTLLAILQDCCNQCGVNLGPTSFLNSGYQALLPSGDDLTHHQVVAWVAALAGANAWIDPSGVLQLSWYGENQGLAEIALGSDDRVSYQMAENDIQLSGLIYKKTDSETLFGSDAYALVLDEIPLLAAADIASVLTPVFTKIQGYFYRPYAFDMVGLPHLWPMDEVQVTDNTGAVVPSIITSHTFVLNQGSKIAAKGESGTVAGYATYAPFTSKQLTSIRRTASEIISTIGIQAEWITAGLLSADRIEAGSITAEMLAAETITGDKIAAGTITAGEIAAGAISTPKIAVGAITAESGIIAEAAIGTAQIQTGAITTALIGNQAVNTAQISDASITDAKIVNMTANKLTAGTIDAANINVVNLNADNLTVGTINGQRIGSGTITTEKLSAGAITAEKIAVGAVTSDHIVEGSITSDKIADGAIKESQMNWATHLLF